MRILGFLLVLLMPLQAHALSCLRPTIPRSFHEVNDAKESYVVVQGRVTLKTRKMPKLNNGNGKPPEMTLIPARLRGTSMSPTGFNVPFDQKVTLQVACFGPWCGSVQNGEEVLAFVKRQAGQYSMDINPCGGRVFSNPKPAMLNDVLRCFQGGACKG